MTSQKATIVNIELGADKLDCAVTEEGKYYVTAINASSFFQSAQIRPNMWLERIGIDLSKLHKLRVTGFKNDQLCLTLEDLSVVALKEMERGNPIAKGFLLASFAESIESRINTARGISTDPEVQNKAYQKRATPVTIKRRKDIQKALSDRYALFDFTHLDGTRTNFGKDATIAINTAVYGVPHFKCDRTENMSEDSQAAIAEIEENIFYSMVKKPREHMPRHIQNAVELHKLTYGDLYFLKPESASI